jgi:hypothetical protein
MTGIVSLFTVVNAFAVVFAARSDLSPKRNEIASQGHGSVRPANHRLINGIPQNRGRGRISRLAGRPTWP